MKNIHQILTEYGITVPEDKKADFDKAVLENYKTVADYEKQTDKVTSLTEQLKTATDGLKAFEGIDVNDLKGQITKLQGDLTAKDAEYQAKIAGMEFDTKISGAITAAKGKNVKAITALLDVETLKASKNQDADITAALEALKKGNDYLFESAQTPPPYANGTGTHNVGAKYSPEEAAIRAAAGLKID